MSYSKVYLGTVTGYNIANNDDLVYGSGSTTETITLGSSVYRMHTSFLCS